MNNQTLVSPEEWLRLQTEEMRRRRLAKIIGWVLSIHAVLFAVPILWGVVKNILPKKPEEPKKIVMRVGLVDLPLGNSMDVSPTQTAAPNETVTPLPPAPQPVTPPPPEPKPLPPEPKPPEPKPTPKPPEAKPKPKPPEAKPTPKPPEAKPKPVKKRLSVDDIKKTRKNNKVVTRDNSKEIEAAKARQQQANAAAARAQAAANAARQQALDSARATFGSLDAGAQGVLATAEERNYLENTLKPYVDARWVQPSDAILKGQQYFINLEISIDSNGRLLSCKASYVKGDMQALRDAVASLQSKIQTLPKPPRAITVTVSLVTSK